MTTVNTHRSIARFLDQHRTVKRQERLLKVVFAIGALAFVLLLVFGCAASPDRTHAIRQHHNICSKCKTNPESYERCGNCPVGCSRCTTTEDVCCCKHQTHCTCLQ